MWFDGLRWASMGRILHGYWISHLRSTVKMFLSAAAISKASPGAREQVVFDDEVPGYALKITPTGRRVLLLQYWSPVERGARRRCTIGNVGAPVLMPDGTSTTLTAHTGRKIARALRGTVDAGRDPFLERRQLARLDEEAIVVARRRAAAAQSVESVARSFLADAASRGLSVKTVREWQRLLGRHVLPVVGLRPIEGLSRTDADAVRTAMPTGRRVLANRVQQVCCSLINFADEIRAGAPNPFASGKRGANRWFKEELTREPISREELGRLFAALGAEPALERGGAVDAIRFLALTGWRKGEALSLRWDALDFAAGAAVLRRTKTGRSERALSPNALALLGEIPRRGFFVFMSPTNPDAPRQDVKRTWLRVRARSGISKPLHALRHAAATIALSEGVPLATVGALLGHRNPATTLRYAKTEQQAAQAAAAVLGAAIADTSNTPNVISIHARRRS